MWVITSSSESKLTVCRNWRLCRGILNIVCMGFCNSVYWFILNIRRAEGFAAQNRW